MQSDLVSLSDLRNFLLMSTSCVCSLVSLADHEYASWRLHQHQEFDLLSSSFAPACVCIGSCRHELRLQRSLAYAGVAVFNCVWWSNLLWSMPESPSSIVCDDYCHRRHMKRSMEQIGELSCSPSRRSHRCREAIHRSLMIEVVRQTRPKTAPQLGIRASRL